MDWLHTVTNQNFFPLKCHWQSTVESVLFSLSKLAYILLEVLWQKKFLASSLTCNTCTCIYQWWVFIYLIQLFWLHFFKMENSFIFWCIVKTSVVSRLNNRSGFFKSLSWVRILVLSYLFHLQTNVSHA